MNVGYNATIGDIFRGYRGRQGSLIEFADENFIVGSTPASDIFVQERAIQHPGKEIHSVDFCKRPAGSVKTLFEMATRPAAGGVNVIHRGYWDLMLREMPLTEATFGPILADSAAYDFAPLGQEERKRVNDVLTRLQERDFNLQFDIRQPVEPAGWRAMDINIEEAFYNACSVFHEVDLREYLTADGRQLRFDGEIKRRLDEIRQGYLQTEPDPHILPMQVVFLEPATLFQIYQTPPLSLYAVNLRDRLALSDYWLEVGSRLEKAGNQEGI